MAIILYGHEEFEVGPTFSIESALKLYPHIPEEIEAVQVSPCIRIVTPAHIVGRELYDLKRTWVSGLKLCDCHECEQYRENDLLDTQTINFVKQNLRAWIKNQ